MSSDPAQIINERTEMVPVGKLREHPANPREGDVGAIAESIRVNGFYGACVVQESSGHVLAGNHRLKAARQLDMPSVPVVYVDVGDEEAMRILLADNRTADIAGHDDDALADILEHLATTEAELAGTGYGQSDLDTLLNELDRGGSDAEDPGAETDRAEELREKWGTERGQLWEIGSHRLLCGDSTDEVDVGRLLDGEEPDMVFADPPYGISHSGKGVTGSAQGNDFGEIVGDEDVTVAVRSFALVRDLYPNACLVFWGANYYCSALPDRYGWIVWDKQREGDTFSGAELAFVNRGVRLDVFRHTWHGMVKGSEHGQARVHPTQKPTALAEWCFENYGEPSVVLDPFGGSGSTIVAAENQGRTCYAMEIDPAYCAVILERLAGMGLEPKQAE